MFFRQPERTMMNEQNIAQQIQDLTEKLNRYANAYYRDDNPLITYE